MIREFFSNFKYWRRFRSYNLAWIVSVNAKSEFVNYRRNNYVVKATSSYTFVPRFCCLCFLALSELTSLITLRHKTEDRVALGGPLSFACPLYIYHL